MEKFEVGKHVYGVYVEAIIDSLTPKLVYKEILICEYVCVGVNEYNLLSVQTNNDTFDQIDDGKICYFCPSDFDKLEHVLDYNYDDDNSPLHKWRMRSGSKAKALSEIRKAVSEFVNNLKNAANELERFVVEMEKV